MLKRVVLIAAFVALVAPTAALADGITFGFIGGTMYLVQPANAGVIGSVATNNPGVVPGTANARLHYTSKFSGNSIPPGPAVPPQIAPTFGTLSYPNSFNFGAVQWTTGTALSASVGATSSSATYDAGGAITIFGNGTLPGTGTPLFSGSFTGPTTLTSTGAPHNPICTTCQFWYNLSGPVAGTVDPGLAALMGFGTVNPQGVGLFFSLVVGYNGPNDTFGIPEGGTLSVVVPEPGTLALFGTGLVGLAGLIRRRMKT